MYSFLYALVSFVVAMIFLVTVHEFGHFWVARSLGVKVLRFSLGFGKPLLRWHALGTEFVVAAFPLGGYIKMVDEADGPVPLEQLPHAFNRQPVYKRMAIVAAGPIFNLLFAIFAYWLMFMIGITALAPVIGKVTPGSVAAVAGLQQGEEIIAVGDMKTTSWQQVHLALMPYVGSSTKLALSVITPPSTQVQQRNLALGSWHIDEQDPKPLQSLGITPYMPPIPPQVEEVTSSGAADKAGMKAGDRVQKMDGVAVDDWMNFVDYVKSHPQKTIQVMILRDNKPLTLELTPSDQVTESGKHIGFIGVKVKPIALPSGLLRHERYGPLAAIIPAFQETGSMMMLSLIMLWKLIAGYVSLHAISGPVGIAMGAGISASLGIASYLSFLALISISLAVLNFLPIPALDGGYLFYYIVEIFRGKPLSERVETVSLKIGLFLLMSLMVLAFYNDVTRLVG